MHRVNKTKQNTGTADQTYGPHVPSTTSTYVADTACQTGIRVDQWTPKQTWRRSSPPSLASERKGIPREKERTQEDRNTHYAHATLYQEESGSVNWPQIPK